MESGIVGLGAMIYFLITIFKNGISAVKRFKNNADIFYKDLTIALLLAFISFLIGGFLLDPILAMLFLVVVSLITLLIIKSKSDTVFDQSLS